MADPKPIYRIPAGRQSTLDGFQNMLAGIGVAGRDKGPISTIFMGTELGPQQISMAWRHDWIARKVIKIPADDCVREWRGWKAEDDDITAIEEMEQKFDIRKKLHRALLWGRGWGGAALFIGSGDEDLATELVYDTIKKDSLKFIHVLPRFAINCGDPELDLKSPWYGRPKFYEPRTTDARLTVKFHPSRVIPFYGADHLDDISTNPSQWSDSVLQPVVDAIKSSGLTAATIAHLITEKKIDVINIPHLTEMLSSVDGEAKLTARFAAANVMKSIINTILLDQEEEWKRLELDFQGMPDVILVYMMIAAAAADIPATRFLSQSPKGLNATGESDTRNYYDNVRSVQRNDFQPQIRPLDEMLIRSALGKKPDGIYYDWHPLWQTTDAEKAEIALKKAQTFQIDVNSNLHNPDALRQGRQNQVIEDGLYPGFEQALDEFGAEPDEIGVDPTQLAIAKMKPPPGALPGPKGQLALPAPGGKKPAPGARGKQPPPKGKQPARDAVRVGDSIPKPLYVRRDLSPASTTALKAWATKQGFKDIQTEFHVTICYSRDPVDWMEMDADDWGDNQLVIRKGGPRVVEKLGGVIALLFASRRLRWRHEEMKARGASWDYEEYQPHITITTNTDVDLSGIDIFQGELTFGEEIFEEIDSNYLQAAE